MTKFLFEFSKEIWNETYKNNSSSSVLGKEDLDIEDTMLRVATDLSSIEIDSKKWTELFYSALSDFKCVPGGRIISNAGTGLKGTTYINCFVKLPDGKDQDSIEGIFDALTKAALILKSEGGYGTNFSWIRGRGSMIHGVGVESPGAVEMMKLWDTMSSVITKGSGLKKKNKEGKNKIRKGAMMGVLDTWHKDIEEFIVAKQIPGALSKFNISTLCSDDFMTAVKENQPWELEGPDTSHHQYKEEWDGDLKEWKEKGYPTTISKTFSNANELWDLIMKSSYFRNEPGVLFGDRLNKLNNLWYCEKIRATNPCGEQNLSSNSVCLLGSLNLTQFINEQRTDWDYQKLKEFIPIFVRMLDNVCDKTQVPLPEQKESLLNKRRIGVGYLGYGSSLYLMKLEYGSPKALEATERLCRFVTNELYKASSLLAKEKGSFPLFDKEKYLQSGFIKQALDQETIDMIAEHGIRNSHLTSVQPTGNSSIFANNVSGGLEPVFMPEYIRTSMVSNFPEDLDAPVVDWKTSACTTKGWQWTKEGDEDLLTAKLGEVKYKFDRSRGLTKETLVEDYGVHFLKQYGEWDSKASWAASTENLQVSAHIDTMKIFARYADAAVSKTINIPNNYPYEDFKKVYMDMYDSGYIKGGTTYRAGTMTTVLSSKDEKKGDSTRHAKKRPKELLCDVHHLTVNGEKWVVFVGLIDGQPYELFAGLVDTIDLSKKIKTGKIVKIGTGKYSFEHEDIIEIKDITKAFNNPTQGAITRLLSTSLRHGVEAKFLVTQLLKTGEGLNTFAKSLARTLKKYVVEGEALTDSTCPQCDSKNLVMSEGCNKCLSCGYSGCS